jgi:nucleoside-diphosphate-sugar epimerase
MDVSVIVFTSSVAVYGFAPIGTDETGSISPFNDYGRTKFEAEKVYCAWQREAPSRRSLVIIRPTVVFGERNRGNVYNLIKFISSRNFVMVGSGSNRKSIAYVENVAAFIEHSLSFGPGIHLYNYVDKPDFTMNDLVARVRVLFGRSRSFGVRLPYRVGFLIGRAFDLVAAASGLRFAISSIRIRKFCSDSVYGTSVGVSGFEPPVGLEEALERTVRRDFIDSESQETAVFYTE